MFWIFFCCVVCLMYIGWMLHLIYAPVFCSPFMLMLYFFLCLCIYFKFCPCRAHWIYVYQMYCMNTTAILKQKSSHVMSHSPRAESVCNNITVWSITWICSHHGYTAMKTKKMDYVLILGCLNDRKVQENTWKNLQGRTSSKKGYNILRS